MFVAVYGLSLVAVLRLLITMSSLVAEDWLQGDRLQQLRAVGSRILIQQLWHQA